MENQILKLQPGMRVSFTGLLHDPTPGEDKAAHLAAESEKVRMIKARTIAVGLIIDQAVTRSTTAVVAGPTAGTRLLKAQSLCVPVLSETDFLQLLAAAEAQHP